MPWRTAPSSSWRSPRREPESEQAEGALRLAGHLAEHAWQADPRDEGVQRARQQVFAARAARATSTMARGVFTWASNESVAPAAPASALTLRGAASCAANSSFFAGFDSVSAVDSSLTCPPLDTPESPAPSR